jgi:hypothetical protein
MRRVQAHATASHAGSAIGKRAGPAITFASVLGNDTSFVNGARPIPILGQRGTIAAGAGLQGPHHVLAGARGGKSAGHPEKRKTSQEEAGSPEAHDVISSTIGAPSFPESVVESALWPILG